MSAKRSNIVTMFIMYVLLGDYILEWINNILFNLKAGDVLAMKEDIFHAGTFNFTLQILIVINVSIGNALKWRTTYLNYIATSV